MWKSVKYMTNKSARIGYNGFFFSIRTHVKEEFEDTKGVI
jgi:hypothetical protein